MRQKQPPRIAAATATRRKSRRFRSSICFFKGTSTALLFCADASPETLLFSSAIGSNIQNLGHGTTLEVPGRQCSRAGREVDWLHLDADTYLRSIATCSISRRTCRLSRRYAPLQPRAFHPSIHCYAGRKTIQQRCSSSLRSGLLIADLLIDFDRLRSKRHSRHSYSYLHFHQHLTKNEL